MGAGRFDVCPANLLSESYKVRRRRGRGEMQAPPSAFPDRTEAARAAWRAAMEAEGVPLLDPAALHEIPPERDSHWTAVPESAMEDGEAVRRTVLGGIKRYAEAISARLAWHRDTGSPLARVAPLGAPIQHDRARDRTVCFTFLYAVVGLAPGTAAWCYDAHA